MAAPETRNIATAPETPRPLGLERRGVSAWRPVVAGPAVALTCLLFALVATNDAGVPLRDPGGISAVRLGIAFGVVAAAIAIDAFVRGNRSRWTWRRLAVVVLVLVSFYVTYFAYRNVKSVAPLLRPGDLFDVQLAAFDRDVFFGNDPAALLHDLLGTGFSAHALSAVYMFFFAFIPVCLAAGLVLFRDARAGLFLTTALSVNWVLAAVSYLLLPSIGPFYLEPATFAGLPHTAVTDMQSTLVADRAAFLAHPDAPGAAQSIGAFASLHTSILVTAGLATHVLRAPRVVKVVVWSFAALTMTATLYFGWHYLLDDVAGVLIAVLSLLAAAVLTGYRRR